MELRNLEALYSNLKSARDKLVALARQIPCPSSYYSGESRHRCAKTADHQFLHVSQAGLAWGVDGTYIGQLQAGDF